MRNDQDRRLHDGEPEEIPWPDPVTEEFLDEAASALAFNLNRLLASLPEDSLDHVPIARTEIGLRPKVRYTGHYCWRCGKPIRSNQRIEKLGVWSTRWAHAVLSDCG